MAMGPKQSIPRSFNALSLLRVGGRELGQIIHGRKKNLQSHVELDFPDLVGDPYCLQMLPAQHRLLKPGDGVDVEMCRDMHTACISQN